MHLTQGQHGAYILFLHWIYTTGTPIPHKQRFSIARATLDLERGDASLVLEQFFVRKGAHWRNEKAEKVIADSHQKHERYVTSGQLGGLKKASNATSGGTASLEQRSTNHTNIHKEESKKGKVLNFVVGKNGSGNGHTTIKDPADRLAIFQKKLAESFPHNGWEIVSAAADPAHAQYAIALEACKKQAAHIGKGWPKQWPT